jgi:hypothetical protein
VQKFFIPLVPLTSATATSSGRMIARRVQYLSYHTRWLATIYIYISYMHGYISSLIIYNPSTTTVSLSHY